MPACRCETRIRDIRFYDEQRSRLLPWLLPDLVNGFLGDDFREDDRNRLVRAARSHAESRAMALVRDIQPEVPVSAKATLESLAQVRNARRRDFVRGGQYVRRLAGHGESGRLIPPVHFGASPPTWARSSSIDAPPGRGSMEIRCSHPISSDCPISPILLDSCAMKCSSNAFPNARYFVSVSLISFFAHDPRERSRVLRPAVGGEELARHAGVVVARVAFPDAVFHEAREARERIDRRVDPPCVQLPRQDDLLLR